MKKNKTKDQEQKRKPRRLSLNRETIRALDNPAFVRLARGGATSDSFNSSCCETNESDMNQNCYPTTCSGFKPTTDNTIPR